MVVILKIYCRSLINLATQFLVFQASPSTPTSFWLRQDGKGLEETSSLVETATRLLDPGLVAWEILGKFGKGLDYSELPGISLEWS